MGILTDRIYKGLTELQVQRDREYAAKPNRTKSLTASTINPTACRRLNWYVIRDMGKGEPKQFDPVTLSKFRDGNDAHALLRYLFSDTGIKVLDEEYSKTCQGIYARVDYMIKMDGVVYDVEFKTSDGGVATLEKYGVEAFPGYYAQSQVIAGSKPRRPLIFFMKDKGSSSYGDVIVAPNEEYISKLVSIKEEFDKSVALDIPPDRSFGYNSVECKGCEKQYKCWFAHIRAETILDRDLSVNEKSVIGQLYKQLMDHMLAYETYCEANTQLRDYIAFLHTKHAVSKIKLEQVSSSLVKVDKESLDKDYIRTVLTEAEQAKAFYTTHSEFFRTVIK